MYSVPAEFYIRLHHVRPRFKGDIENVLIYMATEISEIPELPNDNFAERVNNAVRMFPGNSTLVDKTINNWRTEISSLFGYIESNDVVSKPGRRAIELAERGDLVESFKVFLYSFQYPGAHIKAHEILPLVERGVHFKPAQYILRLLQYANESHETRMGITKAEVCHCIMNDLRCVRDNEGAAATWRRIIENRDIGVEYNQTGDVIRYAGDIIDYMEIANLLVTHDSRTYYLNSLENEAVLKFINSTEWYTGYDKMIETRTGDLHSVNACREGWFSYVNRDLANTDFSTDIISFIGEDSDEYVNLVQASHDSFDRRVQDETDITTKEIGDFGESLVHSHECERIRIGGRPDLVHLIKKIPTQLAVGYDIGSVELDERKRYIEVKTTISSKPLHFNKLHLTRNEWNAASTMRDRYYVYRLMLSKTERKLILLQDPVGLYKRDVIGMVPTDGAEISFNPATAGTFEELLSWKA